MTLGSWKKKNIGWWFTKYVPKSAASGPPENFVRNTESQAPRRPIDPKLWAWVSGI